MADVKAWAEQVRGSVEQAFFGKQDPIERVLVALLCRGHVLIEDLPDDVAECGHAALLLCSCLLVPRRPSEACAAESSPEIHPHFRRKGRESLAEFRMASPHGPAFPSFFGFLSRQRLPERFRGAGS